MAFSESKLPVGSSANIILGLLLTVVHLPINWLFLLIFDIPDNIESLSDLNLDDENIQKLSNKGIKNKDDLAELSIDELQDIIEISEDDASAMIMKAREHWFN